MAATTIDECIEFAANDIARESYGNVHSLYTLMQNWIAGMFSEATGIFKPSGDNTREGMGQRVVTDWYGAHVLALEDIEGHGIGQSGVVGTSSVINAVVRVLTAVKYSTINGNTTGAQQTATIALYNAVWES